MEKKREKFDVIVIGAGHAGAEASLAAARTGCKTLLLTLNIDTMAYLPCNPNIGGSAKGHLVREIDALGGEMGLNIDKTFIQTKTLNTSRGPAVHSLRAQTDKKRYSETMGQTLMNEENLFVRQDEATDIIVEDKVVKGVKLKTGAIIDSTCVVICTGTYLKGRIIIGDVSYESGPAGLRPANDLSQSLLNLGIRLRRFKTGTPARVHTRSIDYSVMEKQEGEFPIHPFSFMNKNLKRDYQVTCYLTYTNENTHNIILDNIDKSPMYNGSIEGIGPRYCPSIEDKVMKFKEKERHQIFIEPEGESTPEMYIQGLSSSLPMEVQEEFLRSIKGLENAEIMRYAYAIEYDSIDPTHLKQTLEFKSIKNLFSAGQFNGTSGYEEAGAQGLVAGINASLRARGINEDFIIDRSEAYIGVLIDDLVTKGTEEPYRMMTARSEYRLELRQDNADLRLTEKGRRIGLVKDDRWKIYLDRKLKIDSELTRLKNTIITGKSEINKHMFELSSTEIKKATSLYELIKRPELSYSKVSQLDKDRPLLDWDIIEEIETQIKYEGYISKEKEKISQFRKLEGKSLPVDIDYEEIKGLRIEARMKLNKFKPNSLGQASRISGVSPADINVLQIYLESRRKNG